MRRRLAKRRAMRRKAGIMKIHSYSTSPPHEEVNARTDNSNRRKTTQQQQQQQQQQQGNGVDSSERRRQEHQRQLRPARPVRNSSAAKSHPRAPEPVNIGTRLAVRRTRRQVEETETSLDDGEETAEEVVVVEQDDQDDDGEEEEEGQEEESERTEEDEEELGPSAVKRARRDAEQQQQQQQQAKASAGRPEVRVTPRRIKQEVVELVDDREHEPDERALQFVQLAADSQDGLVQEREDDDEEEEVVDGGGGEEDEEEEDDGTSSSTASAEEEIGFEMEPHLQKAGSRTAMAPGGGRVQLSRGSSASVGRGGGMTTTTILMTEEDYEQHQQEQEELQHQQQQQQQDEDDVAMDEYEGSMAGAAAPGGSEDMEDTDGALTGNKLFRKKVKRKMHPRTNSSSTASGSLGMVSGGSINSITSPKGKLQMLQEFPTLFIGLRRNRMFLVNSLAQSFDLNQRDIVLTLRKIKQNESSARLANFFGIGAAEVDLLFHTSVPKIADCLRNFIVWPDDFTMKLNVPVSLRQHFNRIHLILNYLVLRVKQNAVQHLPAAEIGLAYCPVDQCHKLKYLVASTLDGCVCFVSRAFGVQTDDEQLLAQSGFLTKFKTNTNLIAGQNFHNFEDRLANGHDHTNNNGGGGRNRRSRAAGNNGDDDSDLERVLGNCDEDNFEDIVSEKISKSRTFKLKNYIENILENFQNHQMLSPHTCIDGRTFKLLDDIVVIVGALINLQKQEID